jgi:hypothetical protein
MGARAFHKRLVQFNFLRVPYGTILCFKKARSVCKLSCKRATLAVNPQEVSVLPKTQMHSQFILESPIFICNK